MPAARTSLTTRWTRFGHDRLYVTDSAGLRLGWVDLATGAPHPESAEQAPALIEAADAWAAEHSAACSVPAVPVRAREVPGRSSSGATAPSAPSECGDPDGQAPDREESAAPLETSWTDLTVNQPGAAVRAEAVVLRRAAPIRTLLSRAFDLRTAERAWRIGADGEELVAARLRRLVRADPRWRVLHAVPVGRRGTDIDHVVVGPGGVFTVNAKHHRGATVWVGGVTLMVNGIRRPYVRNSRHEAARAGRLLTSACGERVEVQGVVVPVGTDRIVVKAAPADVAVVPARRIASWIRSRPVVLDDQQVAAIFEVARRSTTWQPVRS